MLPFMKGILCQIRAMRELQVYMKTQGFPYLLTSRLNQVSPLSSIILFVKLFAPIILQFLVYSYLTFFVCFNYCAPMNNFFLFYRIW